MAPPACVDDLREENDAPADAGRLGPGAYEDLVVCGDDDWYAVDVCAGGTLTVVAGFAHAEGDLDLALHDPAGARLAFSASADDDERLTFAAANDATVLVRVFGFGGAENAYDLALVVADCAADLCVDDAREDDDGLDEAHAARRAAGYGGRPPDIAAGAGGGFAAATTTGSRSRCAPAAW